MTGPDPAAETGGDDGTDSRDDNGSRDDDGSNRNGNTTANGRFVAAAADDLDSFVGLTGHSYRAEVDRMTAWRTRLDQTTNWAVVLMAAILTFAFASPDNPHYVLLIGVLAIGAFLVIESQRYQEYDAWRNRVRLLQRHLLAGVLSPAETATGEWREQLASDLREPELRYPFWRSIAHRLTRVYFLLLSVLIAAWTARITVFQTDETWRQTAAIGEIPGTVVVAVVGTGYAAAGLLTAISIYQSRTREFGEDGAPAGDSGG